MKLRYTDGCTCTSYDVDGTEFIDLSIERQRELAIKLISYTDNSNVFVNVYSFALENTDNLYKMTEDQIKEFYNEVDNCVIDFKNNWSIDRQKEYCLGYIYNYNINDVNADWLYQHVFELVLEYEGKYKYLGHCDCCGDSIREYTLKI